MIGSLARQDDINLRLMRDSEADYRLLARWLSDERVLEFYRGRDKPLSLEEAQARYGPRVRGDSPVKPCIIEYCARPLGYLQFYALSQALDASDQKLYGPDIVEKGYAFDILIGEQEHWNRGLGSRAIQILVDYLFSELDAARVTVDPQMGNHRAIRSYEKVGFHKVRLLPQHEFHEDSYRDNWLMALDRHPISDF